MAKRYTTLPTLVDHDIQRFHRTYTKMLSGCWEWTALRKETGYGRFSLRSRRYPAHRIAYMLATGIDPREMCVLHQCDNPPCVNPDHLFLGSQLDNIRDMYNKNRYSRGERHAAKLRKVLPRGSKNHFSRLTEEAVRNLRAEYAAGMIVRALAEKYLVSKETVKLIIQRKTWIHI